MPETSTYQRLNGENVGWFQTWRYSWTTLEKWFSMVIIVCLIIIFGLSIALGKANAKNDEHHNSTTIAPTTAPTPTKEPTTVPTTTKEPTTTKGPTTAPTTTEGPTTAPTPTKAPTTAPTTSPIPTSTKAPTTAPLPTKAPTTVPPPTKVPTTVPPPTKVPTTVPPPTKVPTTVPPPTKAPTTAPTPTSSSSTAPKTTEHVTLTTTSKNDTVVDHSSTTPSASTNSEVNLQKSQTGNEQSVSTTAAPLDHSTEKKKSLESDTNINLVSSKTDHTPSDAEILTQTVGLATLQRMRRFLI